MLGFGFFLELQCLTVSVFSGVISHISIPFCACGNLLNRHDAYFDKNCIRKLSSRWVRLELVLLGGTTESTSVGCVLNKLSSNGRGKGHYFWYGTL